jgi:hypothetical protein
MKPLLLLLVCFLFRVSAQQTFSKGYIVNDKKDTIRGEVRQNPKKQHEAFLKVFFKDAAGMQKNYKPGKVLAYGVNNDHYVSMDSDGEPSFYKILVKGYMCFYMLTFETMRMNEPVFESEYYFSHPNNQNLVVVKEAKFKKQLTDYMKDNPEIAQSYEDDGKNFDPAKAAEVITNYNAWKATQ